MEKRRDFLRKAAIGTVAFPSSIGNFIIPSNLKEVFYDSKDSLNTKNIRNSNSEWNISFMEESSILKLNSCYTTDRLTIFIV
jgi:hypothetical protein